MKQYILLICGIFIVAEAYSQVTIQWDYLTNSSFRNNDKMICGEGDLQRLKACINIPLSVKPDQWDKLRVWNATMTVTHGWLDNDGLASELNPSQLINANISVSHIRSLNENWMLIASLGAGIYAPTNNVSFKSLLANGGLIFAYHLTDNFSVGLGAGLTNSYGAPMVVPMGYLNRQSRGRVEAQLNISNGVKADIKIKATKKLTVDITPIEFDGMSAVIKYGGKDKLYSMFMIRSFLAVDMNLWKGVSLFGGAGGVLLRNTSIQERKTGNLFSGDDANKYRFNTTPQFSAGTRYKF